MMPRPFWPTVSTLLAVVACVPSSSYAAASSYLRDSRASGQKQIQPAAGQSSVRRDQLRTTLAPRVRLLQLQALYRASGIFHTAGTLRSLFAAGSRQSKPEASSTASVRAQERVSASLMRQPQSQDRRDRLMKLLEPKRRLLNLQATVRAMGL